MTVGDSEPRKANDASQRTEDERDALEPQRDGSTGEELPVEEPGGEPGGSPDVLLDVPTLNVEELQLEVQDLRAHVSVRAELANFLKIEIGVDAYLDEVKLGIKGVEAQVLLKVRLERLLGTIERALDAISNNPQILGGGGGPSAHRSGEEQDSAGAGPPADNAGAEEPGRVAERQRTGDDAGNTYEVALDEAGGILEEDPTGNVADLQVEEEYVDEGGRIVGRARDEAGALVEDLLDDEGNVLDLNVIEESEGPEDGEPEGEAAPPRTNATAPAERRAGELGVDLSGVEGTGSGGRILVRDVEKAVRSRVDATQFARDKAEELGVDLLGVIGSGAEGRITVKDVVSTAEGEG